MSLFKKNHFQLLACSLLLVAVTGGLYHNSLYLDFSFDDARATYLNRDISDFDGNYWKFFSTSFYHGGEGEEDDFLYRPLSKSTLAWDYSRVKIKSASQEPGPYPFHMTNIILYVICVLIVFFLIRTFFMEKNHPNTISLGAALLFSAFPAHVTVVCNIKHREEILACLFGCLAFWMYVVSRKTLRSHRQVALWGAAFSYLLALLSKESALFFLPALILYELSLHEGAYKKILLRVKDFIPFFAMIIIWFALRANAVGFRIARNAGEIQDYSYFKLDEGIWVRLLTEAKLFLKYYFWDALVTQKIDPVFSSRYVVLTEYTPSLEGMLSFVFFFVVIIVSIYYLLFGRKVRQQISFWILFFFLMLFTVTNIIRIDWLGAFRFLFTPSLSYCVLIIIFLSFIAFYERPFRKILCGRFAVFLFTIIFSYFSFKTYGLIPHWKDDFSLNLYASTIEENNPLVYSNLGYLFSDRKQKSEMIKYFEKMVWTIENHPQTQKFIPEREKGFYAFILGQLAYYDPGKNQDLALQRIQRAISVLSQSEDEWSEEEKKAVAPAYYIRAVVHSRMNHRDEAIRDCKTSLKYDPSLKKSQDLLRDLTK